jgi:molybdopterin/thiamine biosynthesis adenylyltransferase
MSSALLSWLDDLDRDAAKVFKKALRNGECMVVFGFDTGHGTALAAVKVKPINVKSKGKGRKESIKAQLTDAGQTQFYDVQRVDHRWLHGRDQDARSVVLKDKSVVLVGCGAVGGSIAVKLAEAGVGTIHCIDPGRLEWGNVGRHELGAEDIGEIKSGALVIRLRRRFPHLKFKDYGVFRWQRVFATERIVFSKADLVIATTGSWQAEGQLNDLALSVPGFPPVLYGWAEAHAVAGHAVLIPPGDACLACHFETNGRPIHRVVSWNEEAQLRREPACGTFFQPFGPIELSFINSLIANEALGALLALPEVATWATWISSKEHVFEASGTWSKEWIDNYGDPGEGGGVTRMKWLRNPDCKVCGEGSERKKID